MLSKRPKLKIESIFQIIILQFSYYKIIIMVGKSDVSW